MHAEGIAGGRDTGATARIELRGDAAARAPAPGGGDDQPQAAEPAAPAVAGGGGSWWDELTSLAGQAIDAVSSAASDLFGGVIDAAADGGMAIINEAYARGWLDEEIWDPIETFSEVLDQGVVNLRKGMYEPLYIIIDIFGEASTALTVVTGLDPHARWTPWSMFGEYANDQMMFEGASAPEITMSALPGILVNTFTLGIAGTVAGAYNYLQTGDPAAWQQAAGGQFVFAALVAVAKPQGFAFRPGVEMGQPVAAAPQPPPPGSLAENAFNAQRARAAVPRDPPRTGQWQPGDDIYGPTSRGRLPSDRTIGRRFWQNEAENPSRSDYTPEDFARMRRGEPPQRYNAEKGGIESMERSHEPIPRRHGGRRMVPRWPQDHAEIDHYRMPGY